MRIFSALQIGDYHLNHCEDYLFIGEPGQTKLLCAVMDGCTMGTDSYFISTLIGKLLRKISREISYKEFYKKAAATSLSDLLRIIILQLFQELIISKNQLSLEKDELLSTLILLLLDKEEEKGMVLVIGDGMISINGELIEFDSDNKPDYVGFHLAEDFDTWFAKQTVLTLDKITDIAIATDGITTFKAFDNNPSALTIEPITFLMNESIVEADRFSIENRLKKLEHEFGLRPTDDLAIIRFTL